MCGGWAPAWCWPAARRARTTARSPAASASGCAPPSGSWTTGPSAWHLQRSCARLGPRWVSVRSVTRAPVHCTFDCLARTLCLMHQLSCDHLGAHAGEHILMTRTAGDAAAIAQQPAVCAVAADGGDPVQHQRRGAAAAAAGRRQAGPADSIRPPCARTGCRWRMLCRRNNGHQAQPGVCARPVALLRRVCSVNRRQDAVKST